MDNEDRAITLEVRLSWLVRVEGITDANEANEIVAEYLRDQSDLAESLIIGLPDEGDDELTVVLYPDNEDIPAEAGDMAAAWSTYHRA